MTHIEWDPSGRTLCTAVCQPLDGAFFKFQMDNGYKIWTWQGELLNDISVIHRPGVIKADDQLPRLALA